MLKQENYSKPLRSFTIQNTFKDRYAVRQGDWVYLNTFSGHHSGHPRDLFERKGFHKIDRKAKGLLYNLKDDPSQKVNLYDHFPEKVKQMDSLLKAQLAAERSAP